MQRPQEAQGGTCNGEGCTSHPNTGGEKHDATLDGVGVQRLHYKTR